MGIVRGVMVLHFCAHPVIPIVGTFPESHLTMGGGTAKGPIPLGRWTWLGVVPIPKHIALPAHQAHTAHTWMSDAAAGICRLKCFCLCFCWTFRANPEPSIPW